MLSVRKRKTRGGFRLPAEAYAVLDEVAPGASFGEGGCWLFARAVQILDGGVLYALVSHQVEHVVLAIDGRFVDIDGQWTALEILRRYQPFGLLRLGWLGLGDIPHDEQAAQALAHVLRPR